MLVVVGASGAGKSTLVSALDAQVRPSAVRMEMARHGVVHGTSVLVDGGYAERNARLRGPRGQPELATHDMDCFAACLRGQADALEIPIIDTTGRSPEQGVAELRAHAEAMLAAPPASVAAR